MDATPSELADEIRRHVESLNAALALAYAARLDVQVDTFTKERGAVKDAYVRVRLWQPL